MYAITSRRLAVKYSCPASREVHVHILAEEE
jgi:hypothetical protein